MNRAPWSPSLRLSAVVLWSSFIGATLTTTLLLMLAPRLEAGGGFSWATLGAWFLLCWIAAVVPVVCALALVQPPESERAR